MRYEYKVIRDKIVGPDGPMQSSARKMQNLLFHGMNNLPIEEEDKDLSGDIDFEFSERQYKQIKRYEEDKE